MRVELFSIVVMVALCGAVVYAQSSKPSTKPGKPTLAVLPFVPSNGDTKDREFAERVRFAVAQKLSSDMNANAANGAYDRVDNVQVDQLVSALEISFLKRMPDDEEMQKLLETLDTRYTIAGVVKGRQVSLTLWEKGAVVKTAGVTIPPDSESPKLAVEKVLTELTGTAFAHIRDVEADHSDAKVEARFASRPNLVVDPGFELAAKEGKRTAANWEALLGPQHYAPVLLTANDAVNFEQDSVGVVPKSVVKIAGRNGKAEGYCLLMRMSKHTAENNGLACESTWIAVEQGKKYRFTTEYYSEGPTARLFIKGFGEKADQFSDPKNLDSVRREFYRAQVLPRKQNAGWDLIEMDFTPSTQKATDPKIQWVRVDLYIYLAAGDVYFDDVVVKRLDE